MKNIHIVSVGLWLLFAPATEGLYASTDAAMIERHCTIRALGDACIFDIVAAADGELSICTKPDRTGDQWRATLARRYTHGAVSAVGVGRTDVCSGSAQMPMVAAGEYIGIVTWSDPSRTPLPRTVAVSFAGPMQSVSSARPNVAQANEMGTCSNDPQRLSCGSIVSCQLEPAGDTDLFTFEAPAGSRAYVSIRGPVGTYLQLFDPSGTAIGQRTVRDAAAPLQTDGQYALEAYNFFNADGEYQVSLQGISSSFRCGIDLAYGET